MTAPERWSVIEAGEEFTGPIRPLNWDDEREVNCVRKDWFRSLRVKPEGSRFPLMSDRFGADDFRHTFPTLRDTLMRRGDVRVAVTSSCTIVGWACVEPSKRLVHYVYVRGEFRRRGIARQLLADFAPEGVYYSLLTYDGAAAAPPGWRFSFLRAVT